MRDNIFKTILFFSLFLAVFSFGVRADLTWSGEASSPNGTVNYIPNQAYQFNITLENTSFSLDTVMFEWNGNLESPTSLITTGNTTQLYVSITDLPANASGWNYGWIANDTNGTTKSINQTYIINKSSSLINLFLNGTEGKTYNLNQIANFTAIFLGKNVTLTSNMTVFGIQNNSVLINLNETGLFYLNASFDGDQNYSSNLTTYYFNVTPWSTSVTFPNSSVTYSQGQQYQFNVTWQNTTPIYNFWFVFNGINQAPTGNRTIDANTTEFYLNETDLSAISYSYHFVANDTNGNAIPSDQWNYIISPKPVTTLYWSSPDLSSLWTVSTGATATIRCSSSDSINLTLIVNSGTSSGTIYSSSFGSVSDSPSSSSVAIYTYTCQPGSSNYSGSISGTLTFTQASSTTTTTTTTTTTSNSGTFSIKDLTSTLSINAGESQSTTFKLSNGLSSNLLNVSILVSGIDSSWYTLSQSTISNLIHGSTDTITLKFNIPNDAEAKTYDVNITAKGTLIGSTTTKSANSSMKLTVNSANQNVAIPSLGASNTASNETQNATGGEQLVGPTGLASTFNYLRDNVLILLAMIACVLIFIFRDNISENLAKMTKSYKSHYKRSFDMSSIKEKINFPIPDLGKNKPKDLIPDKPEVKRPGSLEREIKRDIKELENIIDADKKMSKKKKFGVENN